MPREEGGIIGRGRSRSRSPVGPSKHAKHDDRRIADARGDSRKQERRRSPSRSRSRGGERRRSRSRSRDRDHYKSRRRSTSRSPRRRSRSRSRERSYRHERRRSRTRSIERSRSRDRDRKHRKKRDRSPSSESDTDSDEEYRRRRKERKKEKESKRSKSKERRKEKKREKKEKKKQAGASHWGKYGVINEGDIFTKSSEFHTWLVEERKINPETISKDQNKKEFSKFVEDFNTATLPHEKYYNMEAYERRMDALRSGELLPPTDDNYDPQADMKALKSAHKRKTVEHDSYLSKEQLQELRKVQQERVEATKMKLLGMDVKQTMGVRMDGVGFD